MRRFITSLMVGLVALSIGAPVFAFTPDMTTTTSGDVGVQFSSQNPGTQPGGDTQGQPPATQPSVDTQGQPGTQTEPGTEPGPGSEPPPSLSGDAGVSFDLGVYFNAAQLSLLSPEEQEKLKAKLSGITGKQFDSTVKRFDDWMDDTLDDMKKKDRMNRQDQKFEKKLDKEFAKLMEDKMKRARELQMKKMEAAKARAAQNANRPRQFMGQVASVDAANNVIVLKKFGAQSKILVTTKTVLVVTEEDGARVGTLADFQAGDRIQGLVRRSKENHTLIGVVVIKLGEKDGEDDDMPEMPVPMQ